jgi:hypothetical protein
VDGIISLIRGEFENDTSEARAFDNEVSNSGARKYQVAFTFLQGRRGQQASNEIIRKAVLAARNPYSSSIAVDLSNQAAAESACETLELDNPGWHLNSGIESLGKLVTDYPTVFGKVVLTTNFDPLIEVSIQRAGGKHWRTSLYSDGNLNQAYASGCHVIHLHGFWHGTDTLHTPQQLRQQRPHLKDSLRALLREKLVVVCAYGGWDDVFTNALMEVVRDLTEHPEVLWTFYSEQKPLADAVRQQLEAGIDRGRVNLYAGINCNRLFPLLHERWLTRHPKAELPPILQSNPVRVSEALSSEVQKVKPKVIEGNDEDRPPLVDVCVGREEELTSLKHSTARVVLITGMGGQGKSTLAAQYFDDCQRERRFSLYVWRDCKEEGERFENQLSSVIERLCDGKISGKDLAQQNGKSIVELLLSVLGSRKALFTFDNIDHYVDLEAGTMAGTAALFVAALMDSQLECQAVFTCRPNVYYDHASALSLSLEGISLDATITLFAQRGSTPPRNEVVEAHQLTKGHAFWLDLLAIQLAKQDPQTNLSSLVMKMGAGTESLPEQTLLRSIWTTLNPAQQTVLRAMAETLRAETEAEICDYLGGELTYKKAMKALRNLRALNLIVIKKRENAPDLLELHPLIRHFIRNSFPPKERLSYINRILAVYARFIGRSKSQLADRPSLSPASILDAER